MNRIAGRALITLLLALALVVGLTFFVAEYVFEAGDWVISVGSPHVYDAGNIGTGKVVDRDGALLLDMNDGKTYADGPSLRKATIHWLGDRDGYISAPALTHYAAQLAGYDLLGGLYTYGDDCGVATVTLSAAAQKAALEAMGNYHGTVAVYNYKTGELLCSVTCPTYDPNNVPDIENDTTGAYDGAYLNRFTQSVYIPGSIFKIVTLAAALETVKGIEEQTFRCEGSCNIGGQDIVCMASHGDQTLQEAFRNSCNCAFAEIALQVGPEEMEKYVDRFGVIDSVSFDGITTVQGNYEAVGATEANVAWSGIGQHNDQINPCSFLQFMGVIAGEGKGVSPYLVSQIRVGSNVTYKASPKSGNRVLSTDTAQIVTEYMRANVTEKYGVYNFAGLTACAKTGTGEVGGDRDPNAMLAGFTQDPDYPLAFIVCVEDGGYGADVCLPIISRVLEACKSAVD